MMENVLLAAAFVVAGVLGWVAAEIDWRSGK